MWLKLVSLNVLTKHLLLTENMKSFFTLIVKKTGLHMHVHDACIQIVSGLAFKGTH
jgi:hypothetical protein